MSLKSSKTRDENITSEGLKNHDKSNNVGNPLTCDVCCKSFRRKNAFEAHLRESESKKGQSPKTYSCGTSQGTPFRYNSILGQQPMELECVICKILCRTQSGLSRHYNSVHKKNQCQNKVTSHNTKLDQEFKKGRSKTLRKGSPKTPGQSSAHNGGSLDKASLLCLRCNLCNKSFRTPNHLTEHIITHKEIVKPYKCSICSKAYSTRWALDFHSSRIHSLKHKDLWAEIFENDHGSQKCEKLKSEPDTYQVFKNLNNPVNHRNEKEPSPKNNHPNSKPSKHPNSSRLKTKHHKVERLVNVCDICNKCYTNVDRLSLHIKKVHPGIYFKDEHSRCDDSASSFQDDSSKTQTHGRNDLFGPSLQLYCKFLQSANEEEMDQQNSQFDRSNETPLSIAPQRVEPLSCKVCKKCFKEKHELLLHTEENFIINRGSLNDHMFEHVDNKAGIRNNDDTKLIEDMFEHVDVKSKIKNDHGTNLDGDRFEHFDVKSEINNGDDTNLNEDMVEHVDVKAEDNYYQNLDGDVFEHFDVKSEIQDYDDQNLDNDMFDHVQAKSEIKDDDDPTSVAYLKLPGLAGRVYLFECSKCNEMFGEEVKFTSHVIDHLTNNE